MRVCSVRSGLLVQHRARVCALRVLFSLERRGFSALTSLQHNAYVTSCSARVRERLSDTLRLLGRVLYVSVRAYRYVQDWAQTRIPCYYSC